MNCTKENGASVPFWKLLLFSKMLMKKTDAQKIAYIGVTMAYTVVVNMLEIKLGGIQFSLTILVSALAGIILGAGSGFAACFVGDLFGFFIHPFGEYSPWIGIATGLMAFVMGVMVVLPNVKKFLFLYLGIGCLAVFALCTAGITTLYLNKVWYTSMTYWECLVFRLFVQGQIWNSLFNYTLLFIAVPTLSKVKPLGLNL